VASPKKTVETVCDPRCLLNAEHVHRPELVEEGDFIRAEGWTFPRRVEHVERTGNGAVLCLAEHDNSRTNAYGIRRVDRDGWVQRGSWLRYPNLRLLWEAAHGGL